MQDKRLSELTDIVSNINVVRKETKLEHSFTIDKWKDKSDMNVTF